MKASSGMSVEDVSEDSSMRQQQKKSDLRWPGIYLQLVFRILSCKVTVSPLIFKSDNKSEQLEAHQLEHFATLYLFIGTSQFWLIAHVSTRVT